MHGFPFLSSPYSPVLFGAILSFALVAILWTLVIKGISLWYAARAGQKEWFVALLIVNTLGILEIVYLIWFRPKHPTPAHDSSATPVV